MFPLPMRAEDYRLRWSDFGTVGTESDALPCGHARACTPPNSRLPPLDLKAAELHGIVVAGEADEA